MKTNELVPTTIKLPKEQTKDAKKLVNLQELFRDTLAKFLHEKICPTCGTRLKSRK